MEKLERAIMELLRCCRPWGRWPMRRGWGSRAGLAGERGHVAAAYTFI